MTSWFPDRRVASRRLALRCAIGLGFLAIAAASLSAHDLFLRMKSFFVAPHTAIEMLVLNGTFESSEGAVARERVAEIRMVGPAMYVWTRPPGIRAVTARFCDCV